MNTRFSVVVPVYNERVVLPRLLAFARRWEQACHEVVFSDGGSVDGTPELLRSAGMTVVKGSKGRGAQCDRGVQASSGDAVMFLHADVAVAPDALTHAIEAYVSTLNGPFTDPLALKAIHMVFDYLPDSYNGDKTAREQMHYAQCLAGMAFSNALLGIVHSMAHKTGAAFSTGHIPHGCANAIYLPYVIQYNAKCAAGRYADIARSVGITGNSDAELVEGLCKKIDEYNVKLNIPKTLKEFGINEDEFKEKVAVIAELAVGDACTGSNPRPITPAEMEKLLTCTYYGTKVDF